MRILWAKSDFLHPTTRGGQIRTLETLKRLHQRHEIHYLAFADPAYPEAANLSLEYCSHPYPVKHSVPDKRSVAFAWQLAAGTFLKLPLAIERYRSAAMREIISSLLSRYRFDSIVCDFLTPAPNIPDLAQCVLFQHNVESVIWRRHSEHAGNPVKRAYFRLQEQKMFRYERDTCRSVRHVIAVSEADAKVMRDQFGVTRITAVPTGVDTDYFARRPAPAYGSDLIFVGSMDWLPNIDAIRFFTSQVLPLIRSHLPGASLVIVGRSPTPEILALASADGNIQVTGTVEDVRPYLWGAKVSVVPIRIGGGTRLKIYEAMAAGAPVVSTAVGAEGLEIHPPEDIRIADRPEEFAAQCIQLLKDQNSAGRLALRAREMVVAHFSWDQVSRKFEEILEDTRISGGVASE